MGSKHSVGKQAVGMFIAVLALAGCSGGSSTPPVPAAPEVSLTPQATKQFAFTWDDVAGEAEYRLLENPDGQSGYSPVATIPADSVSYSHAVFLPERVNASYILQACNSAGACTDSDEQFVTGTLAGAVGYVKASNPDRSDAFGFAIALSGDGSTLAVGAIEEESASRGIDGDQQDNSSGTVIAGSGAVYVFTREDAVWRQQAYVKASNTDAGDLFGFSVALSQDGNTLAVGAVQEASAAKGIDGEQDDNSAPVSGAVYVFTRENTVWSQQEYLKASNTDDGFDEFGASVSLAGDGNTLVVGAPREGSAATKINGDQDDNSANDSGAVYVFSRSGDAWEQQVYVKASNAGSGDHFGTSVALSLDGSTLAVGAKYEDSAAAGLNGDQDDNSVSSSGAVYVFAHANNVWSQEAYLKAFNADPSDYFGQSVALSSDGNTLAVGADGEGSASVGINGDPDDNSADRSGAVYVFARENAVWSRQAYLKASNTDAEDGFGSSVSLSGDGNTLAVGAINEGSSAAGLNDDQAVNSSFYAGAAYVFKRSQGLWAPSTYLKASNTEADDEFGFPVVISSDGTTLAVGAQSESGAATGVNGDQSDNSAPYSGAVYLY